MILKHKTWKNSHSIFHLLQFLLPNSTYYAIKGANMEKDGCKPHCQRSRVWRDSLYKYL